MEFILNGIKKFNDINFKVIYLLFVWSVVFYFNDLNLQVELDILSKEFPNNLIMEKKEYLKNLAISNENSDLSFINILNISLQLTTFVLVLLNIIKIFQ